MIRKYAILTSFVLIVTGCSGSNTSVSGKVTLNNAPVAGGFVILVAADGQSYDAQIGTDGTFKIDRVPTGNVKIGVTGAREAAGKPMLGPRGEAGPDRPAPTSRAQTVVPEKYGDPLTSNLTGVIKSGQPLNIELQ